MIGHSVTAGLLLVAALAGCAGDSHASGESPRAASAAPSALQSSPEPAVSSPSETTAPSAPVSPMVNGRITSAQRHLTADASSYQWRAFDTASDKGLFVSDVPCDECNVEEVDSVTAVRPAGPVATISCSGALPCRAKESRYYYAATLGPARDEVTVESGDRTLQVLRYDGTVRRTIDLTAALDLRDDIRMLAWSPDGSRLAVVTHGGGAEDVWLLEGGDDPQLAYSTTFPVIWSLGGWSPDGQSLLVDQMVGASKVGAEVVVLHRAPAGSLPAKTGQVLYRSHRFFDWAGNVTWSPDGTRIAVRVIGGTVEISAEDGSVLARHPQVGGWLIWLRGDR